MRSIGVQVMFRQSYEFSTVLDKVTSVFVLILCVVSRTTSRDKRMSDTEHCVCFGSLQTLAVGGL